MAAVLGRHIHTYTRNSDHTKQHCRNKRWSLLKPELLWGYTYTHTLSACSHYDSWGRIMRLSLLTDNPPSPGKVGHTTAVYVRKVLLACRYFTSDKNQMSETSIATEKRPWEEVDLIIVLYLRITPGAQLQQGQKWYRPFKDRDPQKPYPYLSSPFMEVPPSYPRV